ncbi:nucleoporin Nup49p/NSP49 [Monosporozyma servazzii]
MFNFGQSNQQNTMGGATTASTGLFGANNNNNNNTGGGLFGAKPATNAPTGGLFGAQNNNAASNGGLFGSNNTTNSNSTAGTTLFGSNNNTSTNGTNTTGGLFGAKPATTTTGGLFGASNNSTNSTGGGLFGAKPAAPTTGGLFGTQSSAPATSGGLFGNNNNNNNTANITGGGLFGAKPAGTTGGLFGANSNTTSGGLFGGNSNATTGGLFNSQPQSQQVSVINQISQLPITPMTRISDLPPQLNQEIQQLDQYIQRQVTVSNHLKADTQEHIQLIDSIQTDISYLFKNQSIINQSLSNDLKKIMNLKQLTDHNLMDSEAFTVLLTQLMTNGSKVSSLELDKFFQTKINSYQNKLDDFTRVLSDIESAVNGINNDIFGNDHNDESQFNKAQSDLLTSDLYGLKTGLTTIVTAVVEEFSLFMDIAQKIAELHQKVKEYSSLQ